MSLAEEIAVWAGRESSVRGLVLIGSQVRSTEDVVWRSDEQSDWDFQIITSRPELFETREWTQALGRGVHLYAVRRAAIGGVPKIAALFHGAEADLVIVPANLFSVLKIAVSLGLHRRSAWLRRRMQELAVVIRPGWKFLKGAQQWEPFYRRVLAEVADPRLSDEEIGNLANGFVCDYVWTERKIARGELIAAQRMLHRSLIETNIRFLHELKLRRGERTFPEARRAERVSSDDQLNLLRVSAACEPATLRDALETSASSCRQLVSLLLGNKWRWPQLNT